MTVHWYPMTTPSARTPSQKKQWGISPSVDTKSRSDREYDFRCDTGNNWSNLKHAERRWDWIGGLRIAFFYCNRRTLYIQAYVLQEMAQTNIKRKLWHNDWSKPEIKALSGRSEDGLSMGVACSLAKIRGIKSVRTKLCFNLMVKLTTVVL